METPIIYLIYRRPDLVAQSLKSIAAAKPKHLYVVADGPKNEGERELTEESRRLVRDGVDWDCEVHWNAADKNMGLANRVSSGITWAFESCESAIVLEEDCLPAPAFYDFCEILLQRYGDSKEVMVVSGDNFQKGRVRGDGDYYFSVYPHCWGWATWKRAWKHYEHGCEAMTVEEIVDAYPDQYLSEPVAEYWASNFKAVVEAKVDSWAYQWQQAIWRAQGKVILPQVNLVENVGFGIEATNTMGGKAHAATSLALNLRSTGLTAPSSEELHLVGDTYTAESKFGIGTKAPRGSGSYYLRLQRVKDILKRKVAPWVPQRVKAAIKRLMIHPGKDELQRLLLLKRYEPGTTGILGREIHYTDAASFVSAYREIFERRIYRFDSEVTNPRILDAGANLGLASLYMKTIFPDARITAFEPDPEVSDACRKNFEAFGYHDIEVIEAALGGNEGEITFFKEGADGGRIVSGDESWNGHQVKLMPLSPLIDETVHFLKLDIEGAELEVLEEISGKLGLVERIFCEYHDFAGQPQKMSRVLELLEQAGFRYYVESGMPKATPFVPGDAYNGMDHFVQIYAWRI